MVKNSLIKIKSGLLIISVLLSVFMFPGITVNAADKASGICGNHASWTLSGDGVLTINGTGPITSNSWVYTHQQDIKKVVISNGITSIKDAAFYDCYNLMSVELPDSITSMGEWTFYECINLKSIKIPDSVTTIGRAVFACCDSLESIEFSNSLTYIDDYAIAGCENLETIKLPDSLTYIGFYAFSSCKKLTSIEIPNSVTTIRGMAFSACENLEIIKLPNSLTSIEENVFEYCNKVVIYSHNELIINYAKENNIKYKVHVLEKTEAHSATTSSAGNVEYYICTVCGKYFSDSEATNEIAENSPVTDDGIVIAGIQSVSLNKENFTYTGKEIKAEIIVVDTMGNTVSSDNYDLTYSKSLKSVGTKAVTITFKGNYSGSKTLNYNVIPKNVSKIKVKKGSKAITVSWKKQSKQTSGYQIEYSTNKNFKNAKCITIKNNKKTSTSIKSKKGKKYFVRIRTYKKVGAKKYYSTWKK